MPQRVEYLLIGGLRLRLLPPPSCASAGRTATILLVGREPEPPYERPPLSKEYLRGEAKREDAYVNPVSWYEENGVELRTGTNVMSLDTEARTAKLQGGEEVEFEKALLATGANVNILRVEGAAQEGIHYLRAFGNSDGIREAAEGAERVVLIGGSYIGCEVAASLTAKGTAVRDRDDGGRGALADLRRGGRPVVPRAARVEGGRDPRRGDARRRSRATGTSRASSPRAAR